MNFLSEIIASKRLALETSKRALPLEDLRATALSARANAKAHAFRNALAGNAINIIAEFKRRSPSKGTIRENADALTLARIYESAGAAAISVLTEENYFAGSLADLLAVRAQVSVPILRKDFVFDEWQGHESAAAGGHALLVIVAALDDGTLRPPFKITEEKFGLEALVQGYTQGEKERALV